MTEKKSQKLCLPNGTICNMKKSGKIYFLKNIQTFDVNSPNPNVARTLEEWHYVSGHGSTRVTFGKG